MDGPVVTTAEPTFPQRMDVTFTEGIMPTEAEIDAFDMPFEPEAPASEGRFAAIDSQLRQMLGDEEFERFRQAVDGPAPASEGSDDRPC